MSAGAGEDQMKKWWIVTEFFRHGGEKVLGPFESQELALTVRGFVEESPGNKSARRTFAIDEELGE